MLTPLQPARRRSPAGCATLPATLPAADSCLLAIDSLRTESRQLSVCKIPAHTRDIASMIPAFLAMGRQLPPRTLQTLSKQTEGRQVSAIQQCVSKGKRA
eukprot:scaffold203426_cov17-Tisochrysis_lutea.AAC.1